MSNFFTARVTRRVRNLGGAGYRAPPAASAATDRARHRLTRRLRSATRHPPVGLDESLRLELNCDGYDGIHSTVVCPYYINTGMFAGIGSSMIPILRPEYVVDETVKAILVNQEVLYLPRIVYFLYALKGLLPAKTFLWFHRAIGGASTMKTFTGRNPPHEQQVMIPMTQTPAAVGIEIPEQAPPGRTPLQQ